MTHTERARKRLENDQAIRIKEAKETQGLDLLPTLSQAWEVEAEKERMLDEVMDCLGDVRTILQGKGRDKVKKALARLGEVEQ